MNINRETYESFFILYIDNELTAEERRGVEEFVEQNPDLKEELVMLQETVIKPEDDVVFGGKEFLMKNDSPVNELNCEEYFVLYGDDELTKEQKEYTEQFVYRHPEQQQNFELMLEAKLVADHSIVFPDKKSLMRSEKDDRVIPFRWSRVAVAAAVLLFMGGFGWYYFSQQGTKSSPTIAQVDSSKNNQKKTDDNTSIPQVANNDKKNQNTIAPDVNRENISVEESTSLSAKQMIAKKSKYEKKSGAPSNISTVKDVPQETPDLAKNDVKVEPATEIDGTEEVAITKPSVNATIGDRDLNMMAKKYASENNVAAIESEDDNTVYVANTSVSKKNKLRGVFRKASRIFEKATNIQPSDEDHGIRIANLEFALK
jgi:hypothetical protein